MVNAPAYLPFLNKKQVNKLQTACNSCIRAVHNLNRNKRISMKKFGKKNAYMDVEILIKKVTAMEAWKRKETLQKIEDERVSNYPHTRGAREIPIPSEKGMQKFSIWPQVIQMWNKFPHELKKCKNKERAKVIIHRWVVSEIEPIFYNQIERSCGWCYLPQAQCTQKASFETCKKAHNKEKPNYEEQMKKIEALRTSKPLDNAPKSAPEVATKEIPANSEPSQTTTNSIVMAENKQMVDQSDEDYGVSLLFDTVFLSQNTPVKSNSKKRAASVSPSTVKSQTEAENKNTTITCT